MTKTPESVVYQNSGLFYEIWFPYNLLECQNFNYMQKLHHSLSEQMQLKRQQNTLTVIVSR